MMNLNELFQNELKDCYVHIDPPYDRRAGAPLAFAVVIYPLPFTDAEKTFPFSRGYFITYGPTPEAALDIAVGEYHLCKEG